LGQISKSALGVHGALVDPVRKAQSPLVLRRGWRLRFLAGLKQEAPVESFGLIGALAYRDSRRYRRRAALP
jgi:hypothetical protein